MSNGTRVDLKDIESRRRLFERELEEWENNGDPLTAWGGYLSWLGDRGLNRHDSYKEAIQKCLKYFASMPEFFGEIRLAKIYIQAADICKDPISVYKHMQSNGIGTKYSLYYRAYSTALLEKGQRGEAIKVVERGLQQEARPLSVLQKLMTELKTNGRSQKREAVKASTSVAVKDDKSERNEAFYYQPQTKYCYQKELVYSPGGGELSLEQIRADLPQYRPDENEDGECDMEMTMAVTSHITMHVPVVPNLFKSGKELVGSRRAVSVKSAIYQDENQMDTSNVKLNKPKDRKTLGLLSTSHRDTEHDKSHGKNITSPEEELELLIAEKDNRPLELSRNLADPMESGRKKRISDEDIEQQLEQLVLEKDQEMLSASLPANQPLLKSDNASLRPSDDEFGKELFGGDKQALGELKSAGQDHTGLKQTEDSEFGKGMFGEEKQSFVRAPEERGKENMSQLVNQENKMHSWMEKKEHGYDFTPSAMADMSYVPTAPVGGVGDLKTRLNFSEAELSMHHKSGLGVSVCETSRREAGSTSLAMFNTTLDCEKRAKLTDEQLMFENEFANTEFHDGPLPLPPASEHSYQPPSLINDTNQSYDVFHDSWNVSKSNNSHVMLGQNRSAFSKPGAKLEGHSLTEKMKHVPLQEGALHARKPLQVIPNLQEPSFDDYSLNSYSKPASNYSYMPSQTAESFSVLEDPSHDQSSIAPYHDSWADNSRHFSAVQHRSINTGSQHRSMSSAHGVMSRSLNRVEGQSTRGQTGGHSTTGPVGMYLAPIGAPVMHTEDEGDREYEAMEQSFTQFDIPRPKQSAPSSTPAGRKMINRHDFTLDLSVIPPSEPTTHEAIPQSIHSRKKVSPTPNMDNTQQNVHNPMASSEMVNPSSQNVGEKFPDEHAQFVSHPVPLSEGSRYDEDVKAAPCMSMGAVQGANLSTITEESENYKNSTCSSRFTVSSGSSRFSSSSASSNQSSTSNLTGSGMHDDINPFEPHIVNMMLNKVGVPDKMELVEEPFPKLRSGSGLVLGREEFQSVRLLAEGGFAKVYVGKQGESFKALKVQSPPLEWEVAVIDQLHSRLACCNLQKAVSSFIQVEKSFRFEDTSVIVTEYHQFGSLLDLVNTQRSLHGLTNDSVLFYLTCEMITAVATLHQCGIIHADIKPDNFMLRDFRQFHDVRSALGRGPCLVDFGRAIDLRVFHDDVMFVGSCDTDGFQCPQMIENKPWKWQIDYFGIAASIYSLLTNKYMSVSKDMGTGVYKPTGTLPRKYRNGLWPQMLGLLLNSPEALPLVDLLQPLQSQLLGLPTKQFCDDLLKCFDQLLSYEKQHQQK